MAKKARTCKSMRLISHYPVKYVRTCSEFSAAHRVLSAVSPQIEFIFLHYPEIYWKILSKVRESLRYLKGVMHSLSFKVLTDFTAGRRRWLPRRGTCDFADLEVRSIRKWMERGELGRKSVIMTCSSERSCNGGGPNHSRNASSNKSRSSYLSRSQTYALLKQQMEVAAKSEDYEEAARIRDSLRLFEEEEPVLRFRRLMKEAIANERFEEAAQYRDELKEISPHSLLNCTSDATTLGIRVQVRSVYIEGRSQPSKGQYFFAYRIRITNNSSRPVQLLRRHWIVTDANGKTENVWGTGVIGEQPVILPKTGFEYSSACPLPTPSGRMEGDFEMKHIDRAGEQSFNVAIAPFSLCTLGDDSESF